MSKPIALDKIHVRRDPGRPGFGGAPLDDLRRLRLPAVAVALVFGQTLRHDFVNYDDDEYVYENPHVTQGLTATAIGWAFTDAFRIRPMGPAHLALAHARTGSSTAGGPAGII